MLTFSLVDQPKGTLNISKEESSYLLNYPCNNQSDCTPYKSILPKGLYILETWGAQGGLNGGKGGYSRGTLRISTPTTAYFYIGAEGTIEQELNKVTAEAFNGGGRGSTADAEAVRWAGSGGGGTDIRVLNDSLFNRIIVAGGGGGATVAQGYDVTPGYGGGILGGDAPNGGIGGTQDSSPNPNKIRISEGKFGYGGSFPISSKIWDTTGGGGGGWYGGSSAKYGSAGGGAGGSGYVLHQNSHKPENYFSSYSKFYLQTYSILDGNSNFTKCEGPYSNGNNKEVGHSGNGCIRITLSIRYVCNTNSRLNIPYLSFISIYFLILITSD